MVIPAAEAYGTARARVARQVGRPRFVSEVCGDSKRSTPRPEFLYLWKFRREHRDR